MGKKIKILAIGNSFSQDATALIQLLSGDIFVRNLYIGGCSLKRHAELLQTGEKAYEYEENGAKCIPEPISLEEALALDTWDYITVQQASGESGIKDSYYPYIQDLLAYVRARSNAEIIFHQTWAYEKDSAHPHFVDYEHSQAKMWACIKQASGEICRREGLRVIPCGEVIAKLREDPYFDVEQGGLSLCRDGFHMSMNYGRFAAAGTWIKFFTGKIPAYLEKEDLSKGFALIKRAIEEG